MIPAVVFGCIVAASQAEQVPVHARAPKVLIIGIDGTRPDALIAAKTPALDGLIADGCVTYTASASEHTVSGPGWSTVLCGVWPDKHRSTDNRFLITDYERYPSIFTLAKRARPALRTAYFGNWGPIGERILAKDEIDVRLSLQDTKNDAPQTDACIDALTHDDALDLAFFYIGNVDETGHAFGFHRAVPEYLAAIGDADARVGRAVAAVRARRNFASEDWLFIVATDHGGTIDMNHGRNIAEHREIGLIVSGSTALRGALRTTVNQCDVVATALAHLGIACEPAWDLDSRAVGRQSPLPMFGRNLVYNGDAEAGSPADTPGPADRGRAFFFGGNAGESRIEQRIDLAAARAEIDAGSVAYRLSGWLGGFGNQRDVAWVELRFLDERGGAIGCAELRAVTLDERQRAFGGESPTGFLERSADGRVPAGACVAEVTLRFERSEGICDGYADGISLVLLRN